MRTGRDRADIVAVSLIRYLALALAAGVAVLPIRAEAETASDQNEPAGSVIESLTLHLELAGMRKAKAPEAMEGNLVLSVFGPYRAVAAAFAHEGFASLHSYERNRQGVFVLAYPIPLERTEPLEYRIVVDGVWTVDPSDPERRVDPLTGLEVSVARIPRLSNLHLGVYRLLGADGLTARFLFRGASGGEVTVCGDFDNWDPFIHEMPETSPGEYRLDLPLPPGRHYYDFVYRGQRLPDPLNPVKATSGDGQVVSVLDVSTP